MTRSSYRVNGDAESPLGKILRCWQLSLLRLCPGLHVALALSSCEQMLCPDPVMLFWELVETLGPWPRVESDTDFQIQMHCPLPPAMWPLASTSQGHAFPAIVHWYPLKPRAKISPLC